MEIFEKAFGRKRSEKYNRGGRKDLTNIPRDKDGSLSLPEYVTYYTIAQQYYLNGQYIESLNYINRTIELSDIDDWRQYAFKANVLEDLQNFKDVIKYHEIAIDIKIGDVGVYALYHQIGFCYLSLGNNEKAAEFYTYAIDLKKQHPNSTYYQDEEGMRNGVMLGLPFERLYNNRGNALKNMGKLQDAFDDCKRAISYDENYSNPYLLLSQLFSENDQEDIAIRYLRISARLGNQNAQRMLKQIGY